MSLRALLLSRSTPARPAANEPITHRLRSLVPRPAGMLTVPVTPLPLTGDSRRPCPTCAVVHPVKTVHLWLDSDGTALVSSGVLEHLRLAGALPYPGLPLDAARHVLQLVASLTPNSTRLDHGRPPGITIASRNQPASPRPLQDREASRQTFWTGGRLDRIEVVTVDRRDQGTGEAARGRRRQG